MERSGYQKGFLPYALAAFLIGIVGGFSSVLGPAFVRDLNLAYSCTTWTALAQAMSTAACAPIFGKLGDLLGRRTALLVGIVIFTLGNALSALAGSLAVMLLARFLTGLGTAAMAPVILAYIATEFPAHQVSRGFSAYMLISSASVVFGPTLGGLITAHWGWRAMLWVCAGICLAVLAALVLKTGNPRSAENLRGFDGWGAVFVVLFFSLVLCIPSFGQNFGWRSAPFLWVLAGAAVSLAGLIAAETRAQNPILTGSFLRRRTFLLSILALFLTQGLMQANMTNTIVFVNYTQPDSTAVSGYGISALYLGMSLGSVFLGPLADRREPKGILGLSLLATAAGCGSLLLFRERTAPTLLLGALGILGLGLGGNATIFLKIALSGLSPRDAGAATGTYGLFRDLAAPFGVAVFVPLFTNRVSNLIAGGTTAPEAAVRALHTLALWELVCVAGGMVSVAFLPKTNTKGDHT